MGEEKVGTPGMGQGTPALSPGVQTEDLRALGRCRGSGELSPGSRAGFSGGAENSNRKIHPFLSLPIPRF